MKRGNGCQKSVLLIIFLGMIVLFSSCNHSRHSHLIPQPPAVTNSVLSIDPANMATGVPVTKTITINCAETVVLGDTTGVTLTGDSGSISITITAEGTTLLVDPDPLLEKNHVYTLTVPAGTIQGVDQAISLSFTTIQIEFAEVTGIVVSDVANASIGRSDSSFNIAVSESGIIHVVWKVPDIMSATPNPQDGIYYSRSTDGGATFEPSIKIQDAEGLPISSGSYIEPEITCSGSDNVYIAYPNALGQMVVARSTDSGASWDDPLVIGAGGTMSEQKHIAADGEYVYISCNDGDMPQAASVDNGGNTFLRSLDEAVSFQDPVTSLLGHPLHALLVNPLNGDVYIIGTSITGVNAPSNVTYVRSTDHGATFGDAVDSGQLITHAGYCFDRSGRIIIVGKTGTLLIGDMNTGIWTSSNPIGTSTLALQSAMAVDGDNTIYRVGTLADNHVHMTYSLDGGETFEDEDIAAGTYPNCGSSVNMSGVAMVYQSGGVIYYAYRKPTSN